MTELNGNGYIELIWNKKDGPKLKMVWIWPEIHEDVRLIHVEISDAAR